MKFRVVIFLIVCMVVNSKLFAQDQFKVVPPEFADTALVLKLTAIVQKDGNTTPEWENKYVTVTLPGKPVPYKIIVNNITLLLTITVYKNQDKGIMVVSQNQIWITDEKKNQSFQSSIQSTPVLEGEKLRIFPLGKKQDSPYIVLEIEVIPYKQELKAREAKQ